LGKIGYLKGKDSSPETRSWTNNMIEYLARRANRAAAHGYYFVLDRLEEIEARRATKFPYMYIEYMKTYWCPKR
jgi:hypothetical protein